MRGLISRRAARWVAIGLVLLVGSVALGFAFGASIVARSVMTTFLEDIGASHDGLETLRLNAFTSIVTAGPLEIGGEAPASLRRVELTVSLSDLVRRRAWAGSVRVDGFDAVASRDETGAILIAGLPLERYIGKGFSETSETPPGDPWEIGIEDLIVTDSRFLFTDFNGGEFELEVSRLDVDLFRDWNSDSKTKFTIDAALNEVRLHYEGEIGLNSEPLTIDMRGALEGITYDRIARFSGDDAPDEEIAGTLNLRGTHRISVFEDGRVTGASEGEIGLEAFGLADPRGERIDMERARFSFDLDHAMSAEGKANITGEAILDMSQSRLATALGERIELTHAILGAKELTVKDISGPEAKGFIEGFSSRLDFGASEDGRPPSLTDLIVHLVLSLAEEILSRDLAISGSPSASVEGVSISVPGEGGGEAFGAEIATAFAGAETLTADIVGSDWSFDAALVAGAAEAYASRTALADEVLTSRVAGMSIAADSVSASIDGTDTQVAVDFDVALTGIDNTGGQGQRIAVAGIRARSPGITILDEGDFRGRLSGPLALHIEGVDGALPSDGRLLSLAGQSLRVDLERIGIERHESAEVTVAGGVRLTGWSLTKADTPLQVAFAVLDMALPTTQVTILDDRVSVHPEGVAAAENTEEKTGATEGGGVASDDEVDVVARGDREPVEEIVAGKGLAAPEAGPSPVMRPPPVTGDVDPNFVAKEFVVPPLRAPVPTLRPPPVAGDVDPNFVAKELVVPPLRAPAPTLRPTRRPDALAEDQDVAPTPDNSSPSDSAPIVASADDGVFGVALADFVARLPTGDGVLAINGKSSELALSSFDLESSSATLDGRLRFSGWEMSDPGSGVVGRVGAVRLDAELLQVDFDSEALALSGAFAARVDGLAAEAPALGDRRWEMRAKAIEGRVDDAGISGSARANGGRLELTGARVEEVGVAPNAFGATSFVADGVSYGDGSLNIDGISVAGLDVEITERLLEILLSGGGGSDAPTNTPSEAASPPGLRIEAIEIGAGSRIIWTDQVADRPLRAEIGVDTARLGPIDLANSSQTTAFDLRFAVNELATASASGSARLFADPLDFDASVRVNGLELAPLSPYAEELVRFVVEDGALSAALDARASGGTLDGLLAVDVANFRFSPADPGAEEAFAKEFVFSPSKAVDLLRDDEGRIALKFPLSGTLDDPDVDLGDVMSKATGGVLVSLLPFNWFDDQVWKTREVVIPFTPGSVELPTGFLPLLERGAHALIADIETPVALCGVATFADISAARGEASEVEPTQEEIADALSLAVERAAVLRAHLETQRRVPAGRVGECETIFVEGPAAPGAIFKVTRNE